MQTKREKKLRFDEMLLPFHTDYHAKLSSNPVQKVNNNIQ